MRIKCPTCQTKNVVADDDISGPLFSLMCESCNQLLSVKITVQALNVVSNARNKRKEEGPKNRVTDYIREHMDELKLPVLPILAGKIREARNDPKCSINDIVNIVRTDQIIASKILGLANSALYGGLVEISDLKMAIIKLGLTITETLVQALENKRIYSSDNKYVQELLKDLWLHALGVAMTAKEMAEELKLENVEEIFTGGLLHDFGYILFIQAMIQGEGFNVDLSKLNNKEFMQVAFKDHAELGGAYLKSRGLPQKLVDIVKFHEEIPEAEAENRMLQVVSLANQLCKKVGLAPSPDPDIRLELTESAQILGLSELKLADLEVKCEDMVRQVHAMLE